METWITMISSVGFPIVAFFVAAYALKYAYDKSLAANAAAIDSVSDLAEAVNNNTMVLTHLVEKVEELH